MWTYHDTTISFLASSVAGSVPLDPELTRSLEEGRDFIQEFPKSPAFSALTSIAQKILEGTSTLLS
jgi:MinD-like ATPase involved in chromosome partitioning or flagellar assembly